MITTTHKLFAGDPPPAAKARALSAWLCAIGKVCRSTKLLAQVLACFVCTQQGCLLVGTVGQGVLTVVQLCQVHVRLPAHEQQGAAVACSCGGPPWHARTRACHAASGAAVACAVVGIQVWVV